MPNTVIVCLAGVRPGCRRHAVSDVRRCFRRPTQFWSSDAVSLTFSDAVESFLCVVPSSVAEKTCLPILQGVRVSLFSGLI